MRVDSGYREGDTITPFYDPMVAKVIAHGGTRDEARRTLIAALQAFEIDGIRNSRDFLIACLNDEVFAAGDVSTGFIDQRLEHLREPVRPDDVGFGPKRIAWSSPRSVINRVPARKS